MMRNLPKVIKFRVLIWKNVFKASGKSNGSTTIQSSNLLFHLLTTVNKIIKTGIALKIYFGYHSIPNTVLTCIESGFESDVGLFALPRIFCIVTLKTIGERSEQNKHLVSARPQRRTRPIHATKPANKRISDLYFVFKIIKKLKWAKIIVVVNVHHSTRMSSRQGNLPQPPYFDTQSSIPLCSRCPNHLNLLSIVMQLNWKAGSMKRTYRVKLRPKIMTW